MKKIIKIILLLTFTLSMNMVIVKANEKIKIGLLVPLTGENSEIGESIIKSARLAINKIDNPSIEIIPRDTKSNSETTLEINLDALRHNFDFLKSKLQNNTLFLAVVKAFAYGSDASVIANYLQKIGVDYFAVAYVSEGVDLRKAGITVPILVLHPQLGNLELAIKHALEPSLYSLKMLRAFEKAALDGNKSNYPIHILSLIHI